MAAGGGPPRTLRLRRGPHGGGPGAGPMGVPESRSGRPVSGVDISDPVQVEEVLAAVLAAIAGDLEAPLSKRDHHISALIAIQVGLEHLLETQLEELYAQG